MTLTDRTWLGQTPKFDFTSWIYLFKITETSACQSFYMGKFNNSLQLTKSTLLALYNFIRLIFTRNLCFLKTSITQIAAFFGQAALTACLLVLVNLILRWSAYTGPVHNWQSELEKLQDRFFFSAPTQGSIEELT